MYGLLWTKQRNKLVTCVFNVHYFQATTLNCSHSFCQYCITSWMKRKKECPVCRASITSHSRSIVLDNYIDKMVESLSEEMKQKRKEVVTERKGLTVGPASGTRSHGLGPIEISSDYEDSDISEEEEEEEVVEEEEEEEEEEDSDLEAPIMGYHPGIGGAYYGGGTCYICGELGFDSFVEVLFVCLCCQDSKDICQGTQEPLKKNSRILIAELRIVCHFQVFSVDFQVALCSSWSTSSYWILCINKQ